MTFVVEKTRVELMLWPTHELRVIQEVRVVIGDWLQVSFHPKEYMFCCRLGVDVSQTSGGKITNISYVCQVEIESTHVSGLSRSCRILEGVFFFTNVRGKTRLESTIHKYV